MFHRTPCGWGSSHYHSNSCACRPYEPGLHLDGSELTGLLQVDRQQHTTTDTGQSLLSGTLALLTCCLVW